MSSGKRSRLPAVTVGLAAIAASLTAAVPSGVAAAAATHTRAASRTAATAGPIYLNRAYSPAERAADLVSRMTTAEKAAQMDSS